MTRYMRYLSTIAIATAALIAMSAVTVCAMPTSTVDIIALVHHTSALKVDRSVPNIYPRDVKDHPYIAIAHAREGTIGGFLDTGVARRGKLSDGTKVLILPLDSGGSGGVFTTIVFAQRVGGAPWFSGYVTSGGHLGVVVNKGRIVATMPDYGPKDPNCCPSHYYRETYTLRNGKLALLARVTLAKLPTLTH